tara:strand:+ start:1445 stop:1804 length:360 start_codon:yes stop_codon:yes gene_type:complete
MTNQEKTFLFDLICDDLVNKITKNIKWFKAHCNENKITIHRLTIINNPKLDYSMTFFYRDYETDRNDYLIHSYPVEDKRLFSEKRFKKLPKNKQNLLYYNFESYNFKEIDYETNISSIH